MNTSESKTNTEPEIDPNDILTNPMMFGIGYKCFKEYEGDTLNMVYSGPSVSYDGTTPTFAEVNETDYTLPFYWSRADTIYRAFMEILAKEKKISNSDRSSPGLSITLLKKDGTPMESKCYLEIIMSKDIDVNTLDASNAKNFIDLALYIACSNCMNVVKPGHTITGVIFGRDHRRQWIRIFFQEDLVGRTPDNTIFHKIALEDLIRDLRPFDKPNRCYLSFKPYPGVKPIAKKTKTQNDKRREKRNYDQKRKK